MPPDLNSNALEIMLQTELSDRWLATLLATTDNCLLLLVLLLVNLWQARPPTLEQ